MHPAPLLSSPARALLSRPPAHRPTVTALPLDYQAFRDLTQVPYLRYAQARTGEPEAAVGAVDTVFDDLAVVWSYVLSSARAAAVAWDLLGGALARQATCCCRSPAGHAYCLLPAPLADALVLRVHLGMGCPAAAHVMGVDTAELCGLLTLAQRRAPRCLLTHLRPQYAWPAQPATGSDAVTCWCRGSCCPPVEERRPVRGLGVPDGSGPVR